MWYASKGLKIDNVHKPLGGKIEEVPTPGGKYKKRNNSTYMSEESISTCTNCTNAKCNGRCEKIRQVEIGSVDPRKRAHGQKIGYRPKLLLTYRGKEYGASELARMAGLSIETLTFRLKLGWTVEEAVETPKRQKPGRLK